MSQQLFNQTNFKTKSAQFAGFFICDIVSFMDEKILKVLEEIRDIDKKGYELAEKNSEKSLEYSQKALEISARNRKITKIFIIVMVVYILTILFIG